MNIQPIDCKISKEFQNILDFQRDLQEKMRNLLGIPPNGGMVDTIVSKAITEKCEGSSPSLGTKK